MNMSYQIIPNVELKKGSNIMVYGPTFTGKSMFVRSIFRDFISRGYGGIYVLTKDSAETLMSWLGTGYDSRKVRIIDCVTKSMVGNVKDTDSVKYSTVMDLTGISAKISKFFEDFWRSGIKNIVVVFDSLSTLLMYMNLQTVFRFLHILTGRVKITESIAFYIVEDGMHDEKTIVTLKQLFSGVVEFKEDNGRKYVRFVSPFMQTEWREIVVDEEAVVVT
ncbi:MAG: recombinase RecA [Archaeoglobus sp.]|jgi:KaiC/GvpD/RAD55 family RecA-like ATPase|nr:MAG: recombinase RecA [Archaeoglobus sp.]